VAVGRQTRALLAIFPAIAVAAIGNHLALRHGFGLTGVAAATAVADVAYLVLVVGISFWRELGQSERQRYLLLTAIVLLPTLATAVLLEQLYPGQRAELTTTLAKALLVTAVWGATCGASWYGGGWDHLRRGRR
jgi:hypothetical protein